MRDITSFNTIIVYFFLSLTLVLGLRARSVNRSFRDYAVASKQYKLPALVMTMIATLFGGNFIIGYTANIYTTGIIFALANSAYCIAYFLVAIYIAPKFHQRFMKKSSIGDVMKEIYGPLVGKISCVFSLAYCVGILCAQFIALGNIFSEFLQISYPKAVAIAAGITVLYSAFGGIRAVVATDILQFFMIVIIIPLLTIIVVNNAGGMVELFARVPADKFQLFSHPQFGQYLALFIFWALPFTTLEPPVIQRFLMSDDKMVVKVTTFSYCMFRIVMMILITLIAFSAFSLNSELENPKKIIPYLISVEIPSLLKGLMISGIIAAIMSSADSYLHAGAVTGVQLLPKRWQNSGSGMIVSIATGLFASAVALYNFNLVFLLLAIQIFMTIAVFVPIFFGILNYRLTAANYFFCFATSIIFLGLLYLFKVPNLYIPLYLTIFEIILFVWILNKNKRFLRFLSSPKLIRVDQVTQDTFLVMVFYVLFGVLLVSSGQGLGAISFEEEIWMRVIGVGLCLSAILYGKLFKRSGSLLSFLALSYCLVFSNIIALNNYGLNILWVIGFICSTLILFTIYDLYAIFINVCVGIALAFLVHPLVFENAVFFESMDILTYSYTLFMVLTVGTVFIYMRNKWALERFSHLKNYANMMAIAIKEPLHGILGNIQILNEKVNIMQASKKKMSNNDIEALKSIISDTLILSEQGQQVLDMTLISTKAELEVVNHSMVNVEATLREAVDLVKAIDKKEDEIDIIVEDNFNINCNANMLRNVFYNIIRNKYMHTPSGSKAMFTIRANEIIYRDEGDLVTNEALERMCDKFYSTTKAMGIGLSFCKLAVESHLGGQFKLSKNFPKGLEIRIILN